MPTRGEGVLLSVFVLHKAELPLSIMEANTVYELEIKVTETREIPKISRGQFLVVQSTYNHEVRVASLVKSEKLHARAVTQLHETAPAVAASRARGERPFWREGNVLRWSFMPAQLKRLKASNPTVKLNLVAKNRREGPARDNDTSLGYVLLDLRRIELSLADSVSAFADWLPLNGSNPGELHVRAQMNAVRTDAAGADSQDHSSAAAETDGRQTAPPSHDEHMKSSLGSAQNSKAGSHGLLPEAVLQAQRAERTTVLVPPDSDVVRLGSGHDIFELNVDVKSISNLLPSIGRRTGQYWLSYKLFGDVIQTECFTDTARPRFPETHDVFRLQGTIAEVKAFLDSQPPLPVYLCSPGVAWGVASLPLSSICSEITDTSADTFGTAAVSGAFAMKPLHPPELAASYERSGQPEPGVLTAAVLLARASQPPSLPQEEGVGANQHKRIDHTEAVLPVASGSSVSAATPAPRAPPTPSESPAVGGRGQVKQQQQAANVVVIPPAAVPVTQAAASFGGMPTMTPLHATPASSWGGTASSAGHSTATQQQNQQHNTAAETFGIDVLQVSASIPRDTSSLLTDRVPASLSPAQPAPGLLDLSAQGGDVWVELSVGPRVATLTNRLSASMDESTGAYRITHGVPPPSAAPSPTQPATVQENPPQVEGDSAPTRGMQSLSVHSQANSSAAASSGAGDLLCWFPHTVLHEEGGSIVAVRLLTRAGGDTGADDANPHAHALAEGTVGAAELLSCMPLDVRLYTPGHLDLLEEGTLQLHDVTPIGWVSLCGVQAPSAGASPPASAAGSPTQPTRTDSTHNRTDSSHVQSSDHMRDDVSVDEHERTARSLQATVRASYAGVAAAASSDRGKGSAPASAASRGRTRRTGRAQGSSTKRKHKNTYAADLTTRHFRLSVELRAVKGLSQPANVMAKTSFAGFSFAVGATDSDADPQQAPVLSSTGAGTLETGRPIVPASTSAAPCIRTAPPVRTAPNTEVLLPNGFRYFEFSSSGAALTQSLQHGGHSQLDDSAEGDGCLAVSVTHRDVKRFTEDVTLGTAAVPLADVLSSSVFYRCPFTHRTFSTRAGYDKHITGLKAAQKPGAPGAQLGITSARRSRSRSSGAAKTGSVDWDTPPIALRSLDRFFPLLAWGGSMGPSSQGAGPQGDSEAWGAAGRTGGAPLGDDGDRLQVAGHVRVRVYLEDFGEITQQGEAAANGAMLGASVAGVGTSTGAPPGATMRGAGDTGASDGMMKAVEELLGWEAAATPGGGGMPYGTASAGAPGHTLAASSTQGNPFHAHVDAVSFHALPRALQALALRSLQRWREEAEEAWIADLKEKEREKQAQWENAFAEKDAARTAEVAALTKQYRALEAQLKRAITKAERKALHTEAQVAAAQAQLEVDQKQLDHRAERLQEDFKARVAAEKGKRDLLHERIASLETEVTREKEATARALREFQEYRAAQVDTPEAVLRDRISALEGERVALTRELASAQAATKDALDGNATLRAQMYRLARELQRARARERASAEADLEKLRVEYLAREERYVLADERNKLRGIRAQLDDLRRNEAELRATPQSEPQAPQGGAHEVVDHPPARGSTESHSRDVHQAGPSAAVADDSAEDSDSLPDVSNVSDSNMLNSSVLSTGSLPAPAQAPAPLPHPASPATTTPPSRRQFSPVGSVQVSERS